MRLDACLLAIFLACVILYMAASAAIVGLFSTEFCFGFSFSTRVPCVLISFRTVRNISLVASNTSPLFNFASTIICFIPLTLETSPTFDLGVGVFDLGVGAFDLGIGASVLDANGIVKSSQIASKNFCIY